MRGVKDRPAPNWDFLIPSGLKENQVEATFSLSFTIVYHGPSKIILHITGIQCQEELSIKKPRPHWIIHLSSPHKVPSTMRTWIFFLLCLAGRALAAPVSTWKSHLLGLTSHHQRRGIESTSPGCSEETSTSPSWVVFFFLRFFSLKLIRSK